MTEKLYFLHNEAKEENIVYRENFWGIEKVKGSDINMNNMCFVIDDKAFLERTGFRLVTIEIPRKKKGEWVFDYCTPPISFTKACETMMKEYEYCIIHDFALAVNFGSIEECEKAVKKYPKCFFWASRLATLGPNIVIFDPQPPQAFEGHLQGTELKQYLVSVQRNLKRLDK